MANYHFPRCVVTPLPDHRTEVAIDGKTRLCWRFGSNYPRPFIFPLNGPSGACLTRMGHPGAENHDHHQSVWFAHHKVLGINFWGNDGDAVIRQKNWLVYEDGDDEAIVAVSLGWYDGHDPRELLTQELIMTIRPGLTDANETIIDLQSRFVPTAKSLEFQKTNFGFLAVRVATNISAHFGGGKLTDSEGRVDEKNIFGQQAKWVDYSGPVPGSIATGDAEVGQPWEGITYFDHPQNPTFPTRWHVREDGWMGASLCFDEPIVTTQAEPLMVRYRLHVHRGPVDPAQAAAVLGDFANRPVCRIEKPTGVKHRQWAVVKAES